MTPTIPVLIRGKYVNVEYKRKGKHAVVTKVDGHKVEKEKKEKTLAAKGEL